MQFAMLYLKPVCSQVSKKKVREFFPTIEEKNNQKPVLFNEYGRNMRLVWNTVQCTT
jgi:hypothetical protein